MEEQVYDKIITDPDYRNLRNKLTDWVIVRGYDDMKERNVYIVPSFVFRPIKRFPASYLVKTQITLYFFKACDSDGLWEKFSDKNFEVLLESNDLEEIKKDLKSKRKLQYTKLVIDYQFIKSFTCNTCS